MGIRSRGSAAGGLVSAGSTSGSGGGEGGGKPRPLPVRPASGPIPARGVAAEVAPEPSAEGRQWTAPDGLGWEVRIAGRGRTGSAGDPSADIALLVFSPLDREGEALEVMAVVGTLSDLSDVVLGTHFERARPFRPVDPTDREPSRSRRRPRRA